MSSPTADDLSDVAEEGWPSHSAEILCPPVLPLLPLGLIPGQIPKCAFCFEYDAAPCPVASPLPACLAFSTVTLLHVLSRQGSEERLLLWAKERGLDMKSFDMGKAAAAELVSRLQAASFSALPLLDPNQVPTPPSADAGSDEENQAFREGFYRSLELAVLAAPSTKLKARFLHLPARADGF